MPSSWRSAATPPAANAARSSACRARAYSMRRREPARPCGKNEFAAPSVVWIIETFPKRPEVRPGGQHLIVRMCHDEQGVQSREGELLLAAGITRRSSPTPGRQPAQDASPSLQATSRWLHRQTTATTRHIRAWRSTAQREIQRETTRHEPGVSRPLGRSSDAWSEVRLPPFKPPLDRFRLPDLARATDTPGGLRC